MMTEQVKIGQQVELGMPSGKKYIGRVIERVADGEFVGKFRVFYRGNMANMPAKYGGYYVSLAAERLTSI